MASLPPASNSDRQSVGCTMSDLAVVTCDYSHPPTDCSFLEASCRRVGVELLRYGVGQVWPSYTDRLRDVSDYLRGRPEKYALFVDSADTYLLDGADVILGKFKEHRVPFLFSAEKNCWPDPSLADHFPGNGTPYRFLNAGAWMGEREWIVEHTCRVWNRYQERWREDDTRCLVQGWIDGVLEGARIDHNCTIFQSMYGYTKNDLDETDYRTNLLTMTTPSIFHWNGRSPGKEMAYSLSCKE